MSKPKAGYRELSGEREGKVVTQEEAVGTGKRRAACAIHPGFLCPSAFGFQHWQFQADDGLAP